MSEREEVNEISFIREAFIEGRTYLYTQTGDLVCNIAELLREYDALRAQLTTAERERDEARATVEAQRVVLDGMHRRAERAERVVEAAREYEKNRHTHWQRALWEAVRALDAAEGSNA